MPRRFAFAVLFLGGCSSKAPPFPPGAAADAGARAAEAVIAETPRAAHLVASTRDGAVRFIVPKGGGVLVDTPLFLYEATDDGALVRIGDATSYAALLPEGDDDLTGYDVPTKNYHGSPTGSASRPVFRTSGGAHAWDGKAWTPAPPTDAIDNDVIPWDAFERPTNASIHRVQRLPDGRLLAIGRFDGVRGTMIVPAGQRTGSILPLGGSEVDNCDLPHAIDGNTYVFCHKWRAGEQQPELFRLDKDRWESVALPEKLVTSAIAIGEDGALWYGEEHAIVHRSKDGHTERFALPEPDPTLNRPSFSSYFSETVITDGKGSMRSWTDLRIQMPNDVSPLTVVDAIVPRPDGRAWLRVHDSHYGYHFVHVGQKAQDARFTIGSDADQRNEVRNARGVRTWVGHCPQLFVTLARDTAWSRIEDIRTVVQKHHEKKELYDPGHAAIVEGRLGGKHVAGVLVWRSVSDIRDVTIEATASDVAQAFAENPASPPEITCTVPVMDRAQML
jgi:hypothetical protein